MAWKLVLFGASDFTSLNLSLPCEMGVPVGLSEEHGMVGVCPCACADATSWGRRVQGCAALSQPRPSGPGPASGSLLEFVEV